ncbi:MAG TPA: alanine racemase [Firmicutes bacterium]|mgnify:CR=1 FL=1|nr:alanine racemase [Bacillota bacterium]
MTDFLKRTWATIDLDAIQQNCRAIIGSLSEGCRMMAIVKADAYGHGAAYVSRVLEETGADWFGVSNLEEALQIRKAGITRPILILGYTPACEARRLAANDVTQTVCNEEFGWELSRAACEAGVQVRVHLKMDTGMSRIGFLCQREQELTEAVDQAERVCRLPGLIPEGIFTHFASADEEAGEAFTRLQFALFEGIIARLAERGIRFALKHCCNSAATLLYPEMHMDLVRPGLILYGLLPAPWLDGRLPLRPAMELKTAVSMVKEVPAGSVVSYGRTYTTQTATALATVPIGYADGYPRSFSNRASMLVKGSRASVVGRVCMDQCMLDVTGIPGVREGMMVTVFGRDQGEILPVEEFAALSGTINYESICLIGKRVPRVFLRGGQPVGQLNYIVPEE